jgi:thiosulfate dehydrogenase [quinone] large subunit
MDKFKAIHILRIGLGINMLMHGLVRIPSLEGFVTKASGGFANTPMPPALVNGFLHVLPFIEALVGLLILIGDKASRIGYIAGGLLITVLIFGTDLHQDWATTSQQMIYLLTFATALYLHDREVNLLLCQSNV